MKMTTAGRDYSLRSQSTAQPVEMITSTRDYWALDNLQEEVLRLVPLETKDHYNLCLVNRRLK